MFKNKAHISIPLIIMYVVGMITFFFVLNHHPSSNSSKNTFTRQLSGPWEFTAEAKEDKFTANLGKTENSTNVEIQLAEYQVGFQQPLTNPTITQEQDQVVYKDSRSGTEIRYKVIPNGIKEEIVLNSPSDINDFYRFEINSTNLVMKVGGNGLWYFFDKNDLTFSKPLLYIPKPFMFDANDNRSEDVEARVQEKDGKQYFSLLPNLSWLRDPQRKFPVTIDPTMQYDHTGVYKFFDNAKVGSTTPVFTFKATGTGDLEYQIQIDDDSAFGSPNVDATSTANAGFLNTENTGDAHPFAQNQLISYTVQSALTNGTTYWYHIRAYDTGWSSYSTARSFTIDTNMSTTSTNEWFQTTQAQFNTDTASTITVNASGYVYLSYTYTQIDSADSVANWTTSNSGTLPISQETTIKQEGTGSVKAVAAKTSPWWSSNYAYRRQLTISAAASNGVDANYTANFTASGSTASDIYNLSLSNGNDFRVAYYNGSTWTELDRNLKTFSGSSIDVWFKLQAAISGGSSSTSYYLYYGYSGAGSPPVNFDNVYMLYDNFNDNSIDTTNKWTQVSGGGTCSSAETNSEIKILGDGYNRCYLRSKNSYSTATYGYEVAVDEKNSSTSNANVEISVHWDGTGCPGLYDQIQNGYYAPQWKAWGDKNNYLSEWVACTEQAAKATSYWAGDTNYHTYKIKVLNSGSMTVYMDGSQILTGTDTTRQSGYIGLSGREFANAEYYDNFYLREIMATEPTVSAGSIAYYSFINQTITTTKSPINLSSAGSITFWVRSDVTGSYLQFQMGETNSNEQTYNITISQANTWEQKTWDISGITGTSRDAITKFAFTPTSDSSNFTLYFDDIESVTGQSSGWILSTPIYFSDFSNAQHWQSFKWNDTETTGSIIYRLYYDVGGTGTIIPDADLPGNSSGFGTSPINITGLPPNRYPILYVAAFLTYSGGSPQLSDWGVSAYNLTEPFQCNVAENSNGNGPLTITWINKSGDQYQFRLEKSTDGGAFSLLTNPAASANSYSDAAVSNNHTYQYRVRGETQAGDPVGGWCTSAIVNLGLSTMQFQGVTLQGIQVR